MGATTVDPPQPNSLVENKNNLSANDSPKANSSNKKRGLRPTRLSSSPDKTVSNPVHSDATAIIAPISSVAEETVEANDPVSNGESSEYWLDEGRAYCSRTDGREIDYDKAEECFRKAKELGNENAEA